MWNGRRRAASIFVILPSLGQLAKIASRPWFVPGLHGAVGFPTCIFIIDLMFGRMMCLVETTVEGGHVANESPATDLGLPRLACLLV